MEVVMGNKKVQEVVTSLFSSCQISSEVYFFSHPSTDHLWCFNWKFLILSKVFYSFIVFKVFILVEFEITAGTYFEIKQRLKEILSYLSWGFQDVLIDIGIILRFSNIMPFLFPDETPVTLIIDILKLSSSRQNQFTRVYWRQKKILLKRHRCRPLQMGLFSKVFNRS